MNKIKKFIKESCNFNNIQSMFGIMLITMLLSDPNHGFHNALIAGIIYITFAIVFWLLAEYCKPFRDFFSKQNDKQND